VVWVKYTIPGFAGNKILKGNSVTYQFMNQIFIEEQHPLCDI